MNKSFFQFPSKKPYGWFYIGILYILINIPEKLLYSAHTGFSGIFSIALLIVELLFFIQIIVNIVRLLREKPKMNLGRIYANIKYAGLFLLINGGIAHFIH